MQHPNFLNLRYYDVYYQNSPLRHLKSVARVSGPALMSCAMAAVLFSISPVSSRWISTSQLRPGEPQWTTYVDGLTSNNVNTIFVDNEQVIWVGTNNGIDRFDGRWQSLRANDGLPAGAIRAIAQTTDGQIWAGGDQGLAQLKRSPSDDQWHATIADQLPGPIYALLVTVDGQLWAADDTGVATYDGTSWTHTPLNQPGGATARVLALAEGSDGRVWAGGDALHRIDPQTNQIVAIDDKPFNNRIQALTVAPARGRWTETLWVGTAGQGLWSRTDHWRHFGMPQPGQSAEGVASDNILALHSDSDGTLWIGTNGSGVSLFNPDGLSFFWGGKNWRTLTARDGLAADAVASIAMDSTGAAWLATIAGISRLDTRSWWTLATPEQPEFEAATSIYEDDLGRLWFASDNMGIMVIAGDTVHHITTETGGLPENMIRSVLVDRYDSVWIGTARQGIVRTNVADLLAPAVGRAPEWQQFGSETLGSSVIRASLTGSDGSLWFGTYNGVHHFKPAWNGQGGSWTHFTIEDGLADNIVSQNAIIEDPAGNIWVGTSTGINLLNSGTDQWTSQLPGGPQNVRVLSIAASTDSNAKYAVWAGTESGDVYALDSIAGRWVVFDKVGNPIYALLAPDDGHLWVGTGAGLIKIDVASMMQRLYTRDQGLSDNEVHVLAREGADVVWIGTQTAVLRHQPENMPPEVRIVSVNGKAPAGGAIPLLSQTPLGIAVEGSDLATPASELDYRLRIPELASGWMTKSDEHWTLDPLHPGRYTLEIQAVDGSLNTSDIQRVGLNVSPSVVLPGVGRVAAGLASTIAVTTVTAVAGLTGIALLSIHQRKRRRAALRRRFNPYVSGEPVATQEMFFGRREILERIVDTLHENSIMIHGERRIGKTSLLLHLMEHLRTANDTEVMFLPVYVDLEGTVDEELFSVMMEELIKSLASHQAMMPAMAPLRYHQVGWATYDHREFARDLDVVLAMLAETTSKAVRVVLILDEMDVMNTYQPVTQQQLRRIFMRTYAHSLGAVVAGVNISKTWERMESPWYNLFNEFELGPLSDQAAHDLILEPVRGIYQVDPEVVSYIALHSRGKPYLIQQHCMEAVNQMLAAKRNRITLDDARRALTELQRHRSSRTRPSVRKTFKIQSNPS